MDGTLDEVNLTACNGRFYYYFELLNFQFLFRKTGRQRFQKFMDFYQDLNSSFED